MLSNSIQINIPTYNRFDKLILQLQLLLPQLSDIDRILVLDNCSDSFDLNHPIFSDARISISHNSSNIGICANIRKCFESLECDWLWVLGDDDRVYDDSLSIIRNCIANNKVKFINFSSSLLSTSRNSDMTYSSLDEYVTNLDSFSNQLLISNNIYHKDLVINSAETIGYGVSMGAPHIIPIISDFSSCSSGLFSKESIVEWGVIDIDKTWNRIPLFNVFSLIDLLNNYTDKKLFFNVLRDFLPKSYILTAQLTYSIINFGTEVSDARLFLSKVNVYFERYGTLSQRFVMFLNRILLLTPRTTYSFLRLLYKIKTGKDLNNIMQNRALRFYI